MKLKPIYIYPVLILIVVAALIIFSGGESDELKPAPDINMNGQMPDDDVHSNLGGNAPSGGNVSESFRQKMQSLKDKYESAPSDTANSKEYARLLAAAHQPEKAVEIYNEILNADKNRSDIKFELATVYYGLGQYAEAKTEIEEILSRDKNNIMAKYNLGAIEASMGNMDEAKKIWQDLEENYPQTEAGQAASQALKDING